MQRTSKEVLEFKETLINPLAPNGARQSIECLFTFDLDVSVSEIWPFVIDTSRMNVEMGFPPRQETEIDGQTHVSTITIKRTEEWIEKPWVWVHEDEVQQYRVFSKGWMTIHQGIFKVKEIGPFKTRVFVYFKWGFENLLSYLVFKMVPKPLKKSFSNYFFSKEKLIIENRDAIPEFVAEKPSQEETYKSLRNYFLTADPLDLARIHVKEVSTKLGTDLDATIDACVEMVKNGDMFLSWDMICPHCRGARNSALSLAAIEEFGKCVPCGKEFSTNREESIEVVFHLTPKLRAIQNLVYCTAEPAKKKHIKLFQKIGTGEKKTFSINLPSGTYRIRRKNSAAEFYLILHSSHTNTHCTWDGESSGNIKVSNQIELTLESTHEDFFTLEEAWWFNDRLISGEALTNSSIREIFSEDYLKTGLKLNLGNQVIFFSDIVGSTPFYKTAGDALALKYVQDHYIELTNLIIQYDGIVVKYIGDAIMAAFLDIEKAMRCSIEMHKKFHRNRSDSPIRLRASFHQGKAICANLNVGLDYFGNTVNQAAKIQKHAEAHQIAVTEDAWKKLEAQFKEIKAGPVIEDAKLGLSIRVLTID